MRSAHRVRGGVKRVESVAVGINFWMGVINIKKQGLKWD